MVTLVHARAHEQMIQVQYCTEAAIGPMELQYLANLGSKL